MFRILAVLLALSVASVATATEPVEEFTLKVGGFKVVSGMTGKEYSMESAEMSGKGPQSAYKAEKRADQLIRDRVNNYNRTLNKIAEPSHGVVVVEPLYVAPIYHYPRHPVYYRTFSGNVIVLP